MATQPSSPKSTTAIAVYCGSSIGRNKEYSAAALSVGRALAVANRPLVYGGGFHGLMGIVSGAVLECGGEVTGIVPYVIHAGGGERDKAPEFAPSEEPRGTTHKKMNTIVVNSMHERKVEMAKRSAGFIGLPGGFGTFEEILEVTTWTQLGIHNKPVVLINVLGFFDPLRQLVLNGVRDGFIKKSNAQLILFVDGPPSHSEHERYDWGHAGLDAINSWHKDSVIPLYDWTKRMERTHTQIEENLGAT